MKYELLSLEGDLAMINKTSKVKGRRSKAPWQGTVSRELGVETALHIRRPTGNFRLLKVILSVIISTTFLFSISSINVTAQISGLHTVGGYVYDSDNQVINSTYNGAYAAIIVEHGNTNYTYIDHDGVTNGWYVITIPDGGWEDGDRYWVVVDGTPWGDVNYTSHGQGQPDVFWWRLADGGAEHRNVVTLNEIPDMKKEEDKEDNLKPLLALIIIIILCIYGLFIAYKRPLNLTKPKTWVVNDEFHERITSKSIESGSQRSNQNPDDPVVQDRSQSTSTTINNEPKQPSAEVKPPTEVTNIAQSQIKIDEVDETQDKTENENTEKSDENIEFKKIKSLQAKKSGKLKKDRIYTFMILVKPCIVLEILIAILSINIEFFQVPPWDGPGFFINMIILIIGILIGLIGYKKGYKIL
jgi:hypothetical protein